MAEGMFAKDKEIGLQMEDVFKAKEEFIIFSIKVEKKKVKTELGLADKTTMEVVKLKDDGREAGDKFEVNTLASAIATKAEEATPADFPAVVYWTKAWSKAFKTEATVLQFVREYNDPVKF